MDERSEIASRVGALAVNVDARRWDELLDLFAANVGVDYTSLFGGERQTVARPLGGRRSSRRWSHQYPVVASDLLGAGTVCGVRDAAHRADDTGGRRGGRDSRGGIDLGGVVLAAPAVGGPAYYLIQGPQLGWTNPLVLGALGAGLVSLVGFLVWERRAKDPLLPLVLFKIRTFTMLNVVTFVLYGALISCGTYTVLFLQDNLGYAPAPAGLAAAVPIMVLFVLSSRFGALADRYGGKLFIGGGAIIAGLGMLVPCGSAPAPICGRSSCRRYWYTGSGCRCSWRRSRRA